jgi:3-oxoacyl-[acyl-carrier protein] reductase
MELGLSERTAAVAASSKGLGLAVAAALAAEGVRVAICGRDADRIKAAADGIGGQAFPLVADVSTAAGAASFVEDAIDALGRVDILVTNAGGPPPGTFGSTTLESYGDAIDLNLLSVIAMCTAAVPGMAERGWGRIIGITSMGVRQPIPSVIASNVARAGATAFLKTLAGEVAKNGVTVNTVQPGSHATDRLRGMYGNDLSALAQTIPVARTGEPADFGSVVAYLASQQAGFITGAAIPVDGGACLGLQ